MLSGLGKQVYLACGYTDMRKSINGLMAIVEGSFKLDPFIRQTYEAAALRLRSCHSRQTMSNWLLRVAED